ncbi:hypothetical protein BU24DRAFT_421935 [Aaosphaeria arxii CBS 175.79]|uniref:Uncharacterized protein n=1 Tax=Aaosphaeria arxii CBS 175.79 TaxID=1450172 RepID=A0A6A5XTR2_9PLEO|nr:uncharacterized protein BU24DRAFT_421935 [Aaosphaeria arxii CBS 175.79]KAF2015634.1 hypothetical protein BU24DRAFT_421935 [Aaosphaeria arxii CBS 175.79]
MENNDNAQSDNLFGGVFAFVLTSISPNAAFRSHVKDQHCDEQLIFRRYQCTILRTDTVSI